MSFEYSKISLNATILRIALNPLLTCRDLSRQPGAFLVARFLFCNVAHIPIERGRLYHTPWHSGKGRPEQHLSSAMGLSACINLKKINQWHENP
jgi:hypothetical protein